jgi:hypothetical protein
MFCFMCIWKVTFRKLHREHIFFQLFMSDIPRRLLQLNDGMILL